MRTECELNAKLAALKEGEASHAAKIERTIQEKNALMTFENVEQSSNLEP